MAITSRKRDSGGHVDPFYRRRRRFESALRTAGAWELFAAMDRKFQEAFWKLKQPDPEVMLEGEAATAREAHAIRKEIEAALASRTFDASGTPMAVRDFLSTIQGCILMARAWRPLKLGEAEKRFVHEGGAKLEAFWKLHSKAASREIYDAVFGVLWSNSRFDQRLFSSRMDSVLSQKSKLIPRVIVTVTSGQEKRAVVNHQPRRVYRVGSLGAGGPVSWITWNPTPRSDAQAAKQLPVYVQSHALDRLRERVDLPEVAPYLEAWLADSMETPAIAARQYSSGGLQDLLVEYRIKEYRLGYLVVSQMKDMALVRTFKFLTMERTPEGMMLRKRFRMTTDDVKELCLDRLATFIRTDIRNDPLLRAKLERCNCGHLFKMAEEEDYTPTLEPVAKTMRKYLCLAA